MGEPIWLLLLLILFLLLLFPQRPDDGESDSSANRRQNGGSAPTGTDDSVAQTRTNTPATDRIRCRLCGTDNDPFYTYCRQCVRPLQQ